MQINKINISSFRNHKNVGIDNIKPHLWIHGDNGSGKTNILEAVYWALTGTSPRTNDIKACIPWNADVSGISVGLALGNDNIKTSLMSGPDTVRTACKILMNSAPKRPKSIEEIYPVIYFCPEEIEILARASGDKRNYLDSLFSLFDKGYKEELTKFGNFLRRRNFLLKARDFDEEHFKVWDEQIFPLIISLNKRRTINSDLINEKLNQKLPDTLASKIQLKLSYTPSFEGAYSEWTDRLPKDRLAGLTTKGSHRDSYTLRTIPGEIDIKDFASRGEHRLIHLAILLSGLDLTFEQTGKKPILLIDDIFSELDLSYSQQILNVLAGYNLIGTSIPEINDTNGTSMLISLT